MPLSVGDFLSVLSPVSVCFIVVILAIWVVFNIRYNPRVVELGPTILTTIGIFGTFLGVALGLARFDTTNVQASVPALLAGLKTAFWASAPARRRRKIRWSCWSKSAMRWPDPARLRCCRK